MSTPRQHRLARSFGWDPSRRAAGSLVERLIAGIGADAAFTDDLLGDLAQEHARRAEEHGSLAAGVWYVAEAMRAVPHLAWNAVRHGGSFGRVRVAAIVGAVVLVPALVVTVLVIRAGTPVRLVVEGQRGRTPAEGLIVNTRHPVRLASTAFDARGRALGPGNVHFRWAGGDPVNVEPNGIVTCSQYADASVRVSAGHAVQDIRVQCRPVKAIRTYGWILFVVGDSAMDLNFAAEGPDGSRVDLLAGERFVEDSTVARLEGDRIRPLKPGFTSVVIRMGDAETRIAVTVLEPVPSLAQLRADQRGVIAPVHVASGDTIRWPLPQGPFTLMYHGRAGGPLPALRFTGPVMCLPAFRRGSERITCLSRGPDAGVTITSPGASTVDGQLSFERNAFWKI